MQEINDSRCNHQNNDIVDNNQIEECLNKHKIMKKIIYENKFLQNKKKLLSTVIMIAGR